MVQTQTPPQNSREEAPAPPRLLGFLFSQFGCPRGWLGRVAGRFMAGNTYDDEWVVELLDVQPTDRVLEVGFGPGVAIGLLSQRAREGLVAGVDPSYVMVHTATERNLALVRAGLVELRQASVDGLPYDDGSFDKVCALHSLYFWPSLEHALSELHRVLVPGGRLAIAVRMRNTRAGVFNPSRYGLTENQLSAIVTAIATAGFEVTDTPRRDFPREVVTVIQATRR